MTLAFVCVAGWHWQLQVGVTVAPSRAARYYQRQCSLTGRLSLRQRRRLKLRQAKAWAEARTEAQADSEARLPLCKGVNDMMIARTAQPEVIAERRAT